MIDVTEYLEVSSRIKSREDGSIKSAGASCNTFVVEDTVESIAEAMRWSMLIHQRQGAPTLIMSNLRARGKAISTGGSSSGPCSFALVFDSIAQAMLRPGKKSGVVVLFLDADHPDIDEWISNSFKGQLNRAYTGVLFRPGKRYPKELLTKIAEAYNNWGVSYLCKTSIHNGEVLYPNVCTEIRQGHKGQCVLGAINLSKMSRLPFDQFVDVFRQSAIAMRDNLQISLDNHTERPDLFAYEKQVGLGFVGMANLLGDLRVTYQSAVRWFNENVNLQMLEGDVTFTEFMEDLLKTSGDRSAAGDFWYKFIGGVVAGTIAVGDSLDRLWTAQPTAHTSLRLGLDVEDTALENLLSSGYDCKGISTHKQAVEYITNHNLPIVTRKIGVGCAPELQPPYAVRLPGKRGSTVINQSQLTGSTEIQYSYKVQTRDEVPYETYYQFCCQIQLILNFTEKAHTLSHCTWSGQIDGDFVERFLKGPLGSLYYRLDPTPSTAMDKTSTWDDDGIDLSSLFTDTVCEVCSM